MIKFIATCLISALAFTKPAVAQNQMVIEVLRELAPTTTSSELHLTLDQTQHTLASEDFWHEAVLISQTTLIDEPTGRLAISQLMEAAVLSYGLEADEVSLDKLTAVDITAMQAQTGFPGKDELLQYLLLREPSLLEDFEFEDYAIVRVSPDNVPFRVIRERASNGYFGLTEQFSEIRIAPEDDIIFRASGEQAKTRTFNLAALPQIILAAKAFRASQRIPEEHRHYALLIATAAVNNAVVADSTDFRPVAYSTEWAALNALRASAPTETMMAGQLLRLERRIPMTAFFARLFSEAASSYASTDIEANDRFGRLWKTWGQAISHFAAGDNEAPMFANVTGLITEEDTQFAWMLISLANALSDAERGELGLLSEALDPLTAILSAGPPSDENTVWLSRNQDFLRILETIGRPDIATRHLLFLSGLISDDASDQWRHDQVLRWLGPFVHDLCYVVSFEMSPSNSWQLRPAQTHDPMLDFLDNVRVDGTLVQAGEVVTAPAGIRPYPSLNPEEDCTTVSVVHGVTIYDANGLVENTTPIGDHATVAAPINNWVNTSLTRGEPSVRPYLKLIWIEWFSQAFLPLKNVNLKHSDFTYVSMQTSPLTDISTADARLEDPKGTRQEVELLALFRDLKLFLDQAYSRSK